MNLMLTYYVEGLCYLLCSPRPKHRYPTYLNYGGLMPAVLFARLARASRFLFAFTLLIGSFTFLSTSVNSVKLNEELQALSLAGNAQSQSNHVASVEGWVTEKSTGKPIIGASVRVAQTSTLSGADGYFSFSAVQLGLSVDKGRNTFTPLRITVEAPHFAPWLLESAKYYDGDTLRLYPKLVNESAGKSRNPVFSYVVGADKSPTNLDQQLASSLTLNVNSTVLTPPATIRVYRTATGVVEVVPFREYIKHVLPNEWVPSWSPESLKAGAMAVKSYGWYWVSRGGKQVALGADVKDNVDDQVYDPNVSYASTDAAVDATFNYAITRNGDLFQAQYCAGNYRSDPAGDCPWPSQYMTQWGSSYHADQGRSWGWILGFYYGGSAITPRPPGGVYTGPPPTSSPAAPREPVPPAPSSGAFTIGQGSTRADVFQVAYDRNGGARVLGMPTGPVRWWMQYVSEFNVVAQPFSGPDERGNTWLVFDVLKANDQAGYRAYLLNGEIASTYANHIPPGPEWIGAPTSDPSADPAKSESRSQGFTKGTLVESTAGVQFVPWHQQIAPPTPVAKSGTSTLRITVQWLGRPAAPSDSWVQPLALHLSTSSDPRVLATFRSMTDRNGVAFFQGLPSGIFNVHVKGAHSLQTARAGVNLSDNSTTELDMKAQVEGDTDGDNCVTVSDFAFVQSMLGTHKGIPGFNSTADLNGDGLVTMTDVSLLRSGFDMCGDISADTEFQPLALTTAPSLSKQLSPWLNPEQLQKGLGMSLVASKTQPRLGDVIEVRVQAITGPQAVDGASFLVRYDPTQLAPVDGLGQPAKGVEPGLALPAVMGNWIDEKGGLIGFAGSMVHGATPRGEFTVATIRFRLIGDAPTTTVGFDRMPVGAVQLTNGGTDLLGQLTDLTLARQP